MHSIRSRITVLMIAAIMISLLSFGVIGVYSTKLESDNNSAKQLNQICENRKDALNEYLESVQQSVDMISRYADDSLDSVSLVEGGVIGADGSSVEELPGRTGEQRQQLDAYFDEHLSFIEEAFQSVANHTNGVVSYYYRINPEITSSEKGIFYSKVGRADFEKFELTDIGAYDPEDINHVGWYYIPLNHGRPSWIDPYYNENQDELVLSYVVPIYKAGTFIGVIGMDIRYDTLISQIDQLRIYDTGFFALVNGEGVLIYHPDYEMGTELRKVFPQLDSMADELREKENGTGVIRYTRDGQKRQLTYTTLSNNLRLVAVVQEAEINASWYRLIKIFVSAAVVILAVFIIITILIMRRMTDPLKRLTDASERLAAGDYDVELDYFRDDEVGVLTNSFRYMRDRLKIHISDLNSKAYTDALTSIRNKGAYDIYAAKINDSIRLNGDDRSKEYAIVLFDCDFLKYINDEHGHDKGDIYLRTACRLICKVFAHSPVFRVGGDEFVAILQGTDYHNREALLTTFEQKAGEINREASHPWECVNVSKGMAVYQPGTDDDTDAVLRRADERMYEEKKKNRTLRSWSEIRRQRNPEAPLENDI